MKSIKNSILYCTFGSNSNHQSVYHQNYHKGYVISFPELLLVLLNSLSRSNSETGPITATSCLFWAFLAYLSQFDVNNIMHKIESSNPPAAACTQYTPSKSP
mmetsp:Transcript_19325/g.44038  ORF Transcript_19325/g.44038 Transcript_19325/m.44038 type:complete len:102 (-) Transcript_19325:1596-1901(-)